MRSEGGDTVDRLYPEILDSGAVCSDHRHHHMVVASAAPAKTGERRNQRRNDGTAARPDLSGLQLFYCPGLLHAGRPEQSRVPV